jgi:hypothetical protein
MRDGCVHKICRVCLGKTRYEEVDDDPFERLAWCCWKTRMVRAYIGRKRFVGSEVGLTPVGWNVD